MKKDKEWRIHDICKTCIYRETAGWSVKVTSDWSNTCCGKWADNRPLDENGNPLVIGASGERLIPGVSVAVDPEVIPYGSVIVINGAEYVAHDCGGKVKGYAIDIFCKTHEEAQQIGKRTYTGYVKE